MHYREIELPLHDNGMEPVEFLKSMGISLTPLNEAMNKKVFFLFFLVFSCVYSGRPNIVFIERKNPQS